MSLSNGLHLHYEKLTQFFLCHHKKLVFQTSDKGGTKIFDRLNMSR